MTPMAFPHPLPALDAVMGQPVALVFKHSPT